MVNDLLVEFPVPLTRSRIVRRPNRFIIEADVNGEVHPCHCPTTGRIGDFVLDGLECLVSDSNSTTRKTRYTVEAIGIGDDTGREPTWVGINQNAANRYIEAALNSGALDSIVPVTQVRREVRLGDSRLDFLVNNDTYVEVKTPLQTVQVPMPSSIVKKKVAPFNSTDRMVRHITGLADSLASHEKAILFTCFLYDNPGFVVTPSVRHEEVSAAVHTAVQRGVELWQINLPITPHGISQPTMQNLTAQF